MDIGYSLLLREFVAANEVDYGDCGVFRITCPNCHEAIFKKGAFGGERQHFSHYRLSKSDVKTCELRVAVLHAAGVGQTNIIGHGQTLDKFFETFQTKLLDWLFVDRPELARRINWMSARPRYQEFCGHLLKLLQTTPSDNWGLLEDDFAAENGAYWAKQQHRFATDFFDHLSAANSKPAWRFIVSVLFVLLHQVEPNNMIWETFVTAKDMQLAKLFGKLNDELTGPIAKKVVEFVKVPSGPVKLFHGLLYRAAPMVYYLLYCIPYFNMLDEQFGKDAGINKTLLFKLITPIPRQDVDGPRFI